MVTRDINGPRREPDDDGEIEVMEQVLLLWRRRWILLSVAVVCGVAALAFTLTRPRTYEATVRLMIVSPKALAGDTPAVMNLPTLRALVANRTVATTVVREFGLGEPPLGIAPETLVSGHLSVEPVPDTTFVILRVKLPQAELAAKVANRIAELVAELARDVTQEDTVLTRDQVKAQLDQAHRRFEGARSRLESFKRKAQVEALRADVTAALQQRSRLLPLAVQIEAEKARLSKAEEQLASRQRVDTLRRTIDNDPGRAEALRRESAGKSSALGLEARNEYVNRVYEDLDKQVAGIRTKLSGLEKERAVLTDVRKLDSGQLSALNALYANESELLQYEAEFEVAKAILVDVATRYERTELQMAAQTTQLQLLDRALPPSRPVSAGVLRNVVAGTGAGFVLSSIAVLLLAAFDSARARRSSPGAGAAV